MKVGSLVHHGLLNALLLLLLLAGQTLRAQGQRPQEQLPAWRKAMSTMLPSSNDSITNYVLMRVYDSLYPDTADLLLAEAHKHLGTPYRFGGKGPKVFDCAGFARYVYARFGYDLPGGSIPQSRLGRPIKDRRKLQRGDLVFFQGRPGHGGVGHTGIVSEVDTVTGVFRFIHAATSTGVIYSYSTEEYYARRYVGARRLLPDRQKPEAPLPPKRKKR